MPSIPAKRPLTFADGVSCTLGGLALIVVLVFTRAGFAEMYRDIGYAVLPLLTRVVLHPAWRIGVPATLVAALVAALVARPAPRYVLAIAFIAVIAAAVSYYGVYMPLWQLAGNIK